MTKAQVPEFLPPGEFDSEVWILGGHFSKEEIEKLFPDGMDDCKVVEVTGHGYVRSEFTGEEDHQFGWTWYDRPIRGVVRKATRISVEEIVSGQARP